MRGFVHTCQIKKKEGWVSEPKIIECFLMQYCGYCARGAPWRDHPPDLEWPMIDIQSYTSTPSRSRSPRWTLCQESKVFYGCYLYWAACPLGQVNLTTLSKIFLKKGELFEKKHVYRYFLRFLGLKPSFRLNSIKYC